MDSLPRANHKTMGPPPAPLKKGNRVIWLGGTGPQNLTWNDMMILGKEAEPHGGIRVISYDPVEMSYMVECSMAAIGAIDSKSKKDAAARGDIPLPKKRSKSAKKSK